MTNFTANKNWNNIAIELVNNWTEINLLIWQNWLDFLDSILLELPNSQELADNQELVKNFLILFGDTWKNIFPKIETAADWQQFLTKSIELMQDKLLSLSTAALKTTQNTTELWQTYLQQIEKFNQIWIETFGSLPKNLSEATIGKTSAFIELNNLYWNLYEKTLGAWMHTPSIGLNREVNGKILQGFANWQNLYKTSIDYQIILGDIQIKSCQALLKKLVSLSEEQKTIKDWRDFQAIWCEVADNVFEKAFFEEYNLKIRGKFLNALNSYRIHQQELTEIYMKMMNFPLRSEVDEIHKNVYELRKEVKHFQKHNLPRLSSKLELLGLMVLWHYG